MPVHVLAGCPCFFFEPIISKKRNPDEEEEEEEEEGEGGEGGGAKKLLDQFLRSAYKSHRSPLFRYQPTDHAMVSAFVVSPKTYLELKSSSNTLRASST